MQSKEPPKRVIVIPIQPQAGEESTVYEIRALLGRFLAALGMTITLFGNTAKYYKNMNTINKTMRFLTIATLAASMCLAAQAQIATPVSPYKIQFGYDAAGNRIKREMIFLSDEVLKTSGDTTDSANAGIVQKGDENEPESASAGTSQEAIENEPEQAIEYYEASLGEAKFSIFPNPVEEKLTVVISNLKDQAATKLSVHDLSGKLLIEIAALTEVNDLDFSKWTSGAYILKIIHGDDFKEWVVVKE